MAAISEGEVAVYDRQLRLWGVQAQQRLLKAKVLIWGLEGSNVEACKNLVLAGVSLVLRDHRKVTLADVGFNYFLREEDIGKNRAECAAQRVQEMNPLCVVSALTSSPDEATGAEKLKEAVKDFDIVLLGLGVLGWNVDQASALDAACREKGAGFLLTLSAGEIAFFFSNLHEHQVLERASAQGGGPGSTATAEAAEPETLSFPSFAEWLSTAPEDLAKQKADATFQLTALFLAFAKSGKAAATAAADFEAYCRDTARVEPKVDGYASLKEVFALFFLEPLVPVASVIGGLLAQEVIKGITKRDPPLVNSVCFNAHTSTAFVERIPAAAASKKRKAEEPVADLLD